MFSNNCRLLISVQCFILNGVNVAIHQTIVMRRKKVFQANNKCRKWSSSYINLLLHKKENTVGKKKMLKTRQNYQRIKNLIASLALNSYMMEYNADLLKMDKQCQLYMLWQVLWSQLHRHVKIQSYLNY